MTMASLGAFVARNLELCDAHREIYLLLSMSQQLLPAQLDGNVPSSGSFLGPNTSRQFQRHH